MRLLVAGLLAATALSGCGGPSEAHVDGTQVRDGIAVKMRLGATHDGLRLDARIENQRSVPLVLRQDGCGFVGVAEVARTTHQPRGRTWTGSVQVLKRHVLEDQVGSEAPEELAAVRKKCVGDGRAETLTLQPGEVRHEHWITGGRPSLVDVVGADHAMARLSVFEPDKKVPSLLLARPVSSVAKWKVSYPQGPSEGQRFDALFAHPSLRRAFAAEPPASWRDVTLNVISGAVRLRAVSARYERPFVVTDDGKRIQFDPPGPADRVGVPYPDAPGDLPPKIRLTPEPDGYVATHDVLAGALELPSGRLAVDSVFDENTKVVDERARPGEHPFRVTLAQPVNGSGESVALATLQVSDRPTESWRYVLTVGVDGGTAMFSSVEGVKARASVAPEASGAAYAADLDALAARLHVANRPLGKGTNLMTFETGEGSGRYKLYVGLDADGQPTRYVLDCGLLQLGWPKPPKKEKD